jgi:hypothetical protein
MDEITYECGALLEYMDKNLEKKTSPHVTLSTINPTWCVLGLRLFLYGESLANTVL